MSTAPSAKDQPQVTDSMLISRVRAGDEDALRQLLWNLIDNAARHGRSGVDVELKENAGWARLMVADDGQGVPAPERERIEGRRGWQ